MMTSEVRDQILKVRDTGLTNMFDVNAVQRIAFGMDLFDLAIYLDDRENRREYAHFIMTGDTE